MKDEAIFYESRSLASPRRDALLAVVLGAGFASLWRLVAWRARPGEGLPFALLGVTVLVVTLVLSRVSLRTTVFRGGVLVELAGARERRSFVPSQLRGARVGPFDPERDDDGWGRLQSVRPSLAWGARGRRGVWLERNEAPDLFVPSARPEELARAICDIVSDAKG